MRVQAYGLWRELLVVLASRLSKCTLAEFQQEAPEVWLNGALPVQALLGWAARPAKWKGALPLSLRCMLPVGPVRTPQGRSALDPGHPSCQWNGELARFSSKVSGGGLT